MTMYPDAHLYSKNRPMQVYDTEIFLSSIVAKMDWRRQEEDVVMDIGCGSGNSDLEQFLPAFPKVKKLIGMDITPDMIEFAKKNNASEKIEYHVSDIEDRDSVKQWFNQISKIVSVYCFNWLRNQEEAFKNVYSMLKPGGQAALVFALKTPLWDSFKVLMEKPKWEKYLENANPYIPESHYKNYDASYYRSLLDGIGFNVIICEDEQRTYVHANDDSLRGALATTVLNKYIPDELRKEFLEELIVNFLEYNPRSPDGKPTFHYRCINILVQKSST